jgi:hypothetical protein
MSNLNSVVNAAIDKNSMLLKKKDDILAIGRIVQSRGSNNAATRTVRSLVSKLKSQHARNLNTVLAQAKLAAKLTRGGSKTRKTSKTIRRRRN